MERQIDKLIIFTPLYHTNILGKNLFMLQSPKWILYARQVTLSSFHIFLMWEGILEKYINKICFLTEKNPKNLKRWQHQIKKDIRFTLSFYLHQTLLAQIWICDHRHFLPLFFLWKKIRINEKIKQSADSWIFSIFLGHSWNIERYPWKLPESY